MDEYTCLTIVSRAGEEQTAFAARLSEFWTRMLRGHQDAFEQVYAEATRFERRDDRWARQYLVAAGVLPLLEQALAAEGLGHDPVGPDDTYSRYEATPPDWMQIQH